jgi:hypothetical protein
MKKTTSRQKSIKESKTTPTPETDKLDKQWLSMERQWLSLEREKFEFHRIEAVSRLAIELGSGEVGTEEERSPDIEGAIKLLAGSRRALYGMTEQEVTKWKERVALDIASSMEPPLHWYPAKAKQRPGADSPKLTWDVLCNPTAKPNEWITVGYWKHDGEEGTDGMEYKRKWEKIGEVKNGRVQGWEVLRDKERGIRILRNALGIICSQSKEMKDHKVSESDVSRIMAEPEISEPLFRALVEARKRLGSESQKGSAAVSATPPRGKRAAGK